MESYDKYAAKKTGQKGFGMWSPITLLASFSLCIRSKRLLDWREGQTESKKKPPPRARFLKYIPGFFSANRLLFIISPLVIVNSVCPGMVNTDIGRQIASKTWFHALCLWITLLIMAKSADLGSRICVLAALKPNENHVSGIDKTSVRYIYE